MFAPNCLAFLLFWLGNARSAESQETAVTSQDHARETDSVSRRMVAASKLTKLTRRADSLGLCKSFDLDYVEEDQTSGKTDSYAATIQVDSSKGVLLLEDYEHLMHKVECAYDKITLSFSGYHNQTIDFMDELKGGFLVTSHLGCNESGARELFSVEAYELSQEGMMASLFVRRITWKAAFSNMTVHIGRVKNARLAYQPRKELRRQDSTSTPTGSAAAITTSDTLPLATQILDEDIDYDVVTAGCTNCTTTGSIDFDAELDFANGLGGSVSIGLEDFSAHMALRASLPNTQEYEIPLPIDKNITFDIPIIGSASFVWLPSIFFLSYSFDGNIEFEFGFDVQAPDMVTLRLDIDDPSSSSKSDFNWTATALPFNATVDVNNLNITLGLRNRIMVEYRDDDDDDKIHRNGTGSDADQYAGIYLDLPALTTVISKLESVDAECYPLDSSNTTDDDLEAQVLSNAYSIQPFAQMRIGVDADLPAINPVRKVLYEVEGPPITKGCLSFDSDSKSYVAASEAVNEAKKNGATVLMSPFASSFGVSVLTLALVIFFV